MSVEKALAHLQSGLSAMSGGHSRAFQNLIRAIGEAKTRDEEDRIMRREVQALKELCAHPDLNPKQRKEVLVRLLYCEMLGHDVSFGHIHAVKFAQQTTLVEKRVGYLATSLFLHENHELTLLLVNSLQRDLESTNILIVCSAMTVISKVIGSDMVPVFVPLIKKKLTHQREIVRKKAVMTLHRIWCMAPTQLSDIQDICRQVLCDRDPGVMAACLHIFHDLICEAPEENTDLTSSFVSILKQIVEGRLPHEFDYHNMPSPWTQMKLLRILAMLGADDLKASEMMYEVLSLTLTRADTGNPIGYSVTYEVIRTITSIYPNSQLVEKAAKSLSRFLTSTNNNYKYFGITLLASIVQVDPKYAADHQMVVINCLDDPDETLKRKTLDLLYHMTNPHNVEVICERLVSYLRSTVDDFFRADLVARVTELAEKFAPNNSWFMQTMNAVFELGGSLVRPEVAHNLMRLLAEGTEDEDQDLELRLYAVESYMELTDHLILPNILVKIMCWVLGEYSYLSEDYSAKDVLTALCKLLDRQYESNAETHGWIVSAISKIVSQQNQLPGEVWARVSKFLSSASTDLQQRCYEMKLLSAQPALMQEVLPTDASCEDLEVDGSLSFLDDIVSDAMARGCPTYKPASQRKSAFKPPDEEEPQEDSGRVAGLNVTPYAAPQQSAAASALFRGLAASPAAPSSASAGEEASSHAVVSTVGQSTTAESTGSGDDSRSDGASSAGARSSPQVTRQTQSGLEVAGPRLWGRGGYAKKQTAVPESSPSAAAAAADASVAEPTSSGDSLQTDGGFASPRSPGQFGATGKSAASVEPTSADSEGGVPLTEEERSKRELAGAIFGTSSAGRGAGILTGKGKSRAQKRRQQQQAANASSNTSALSQSNVAAMNASSASPSAQHVADGNAGGSSLLDLDMFSSATGTSHGNDSVVPAAASQNQGGSSAAVDLLDLDWGGVASGGTANASTGSGAASVGATQLMMSPSPAASADLMQAAPAAQNGLVNLLDGMEISQPSTSPAPAAVDIGAATSQPPMQPALSQSSNAAPDTSSPSFSFLAQEPSQDLPAPLTATPNTNQLPASLQAFPHNSIREDLCADDSVRLAVQRVWRPGAAVFVFYVTNSKQTNVDGVKFQIQPPSAFQAEYVDSSPGVSGWSGVTVAASQTACFVLNVSGKTVAKTMVMKGELAYQAGAATAAKRQIFSMNILLSDLLRPLEVTTNEFGGRWGSTSHESKTKLSTSIPDLPSFMERVQNRIRIHPVQIIGNEAIAAGTILGNPGTHCLVHSKLVSGQLDLWVRSASNLLTECLVQFSSSSLRS
ncbi:AP-4 complex subunit epsilon-1-like [Sycon ciliatum]|uniref:AP-4 complex subunit epsilon-1-like n=1 Tax=Sycon ciliatum TaxID=27933 RepID=UPI0031F66D63